MATIKIDNIELPMTGIYEHISRNQLTANKEFDLSKEDLPDLSGMAGKTTFTSLSIKDEEGRDIPYVCDYNRITDFTSSYIDDEHKYFGYNLALGKEEE